MASWRSTTKGASLIEAILALAIFGILAVSLGAVTGGGFLGVIRGDQYTQAAALAEEAIEAVRSVRDRAYNEFVHTTSSVAVSSSAWVFDGLPVEQIGEFTREIRFDAVCRDNADDIVDCPGDYTDAHSRKITASVSWEIHTGVTTTIERVAYITNWDSSDWTQTDWSGGSGQAVWSDETMYESDDGNVDTITVGQVQLAPLGESCGVYGWEMDIEGDYVYNATDIDVLGGFAQVAPQGQVTVGNTTDPGFDTGSPWSSGTWDQDAGDNIFNNRISSLGNPTWTAYNYPYLTSAGREVGGYWEQSFFVSKSNPEIVSVEFDYNLYFNLILSGDTGDLYAFVDNFSGAPSGPGSAIWNYSVTGVEPTNVWNEDIVVSATSSITTPGTYYLKFAAYLDSNGSGSGGARRIVGLWDNASLTWQKTESIYATNTPDIYPIRDYEPNEVGRWISFTETASKDGGEIYYQLSDDEGVTWRYWTGATWAVAGSSNYNTASVVDANISSFSTSTGEIRFRAFLESDGTQFVQLDTVEIGCERFQSYPFDTPANYTYDPLPIEVASGTAHMMIVPGGVTGIADTLVDSYEYNTSQGRYPDILNVGPNVYAVSHRGAGSDGFIRTMTITPNGDVTPAIIDTLEFDTSVAAFTKLIHISGTTYAVVYRGPGNDGFIKTMDIDAIGNVGNVLDTVEFDTVNANWPDIVHVSGDTYAIVYQGDGSDGFLKTLSISAAGNISAVIDTYEYNTTNGREPAILHVAGDVFAVSYRGNGADGFVSTFQISAAGSITPSAINTFEFDTSNGRQTDMMHISGDVYAVVYQGAGTDGFLKTIDIDSAGTIAGTIDTFEFDATEGQWPNISYVRDNVYAIAYQGAGADGFVTLVTIETDGQVGDTVIDTLEYDTISGREPELITLSTSSVAVVSAGNGNDGFVYTIGIEADPPGYSMLYPTIQPVTALSTPNIAAWTSFQETADKNGGALYYQLSDDNGSTWQYWDGGAWAVSSTQYNIASVINSNIGSFSTSTGSMLFRAFYESDGTQEVILDDIRFGWSDITGNNGFVGGGALVSSAFDMGAASKLQIIEWDEVVPACSPTCTVQLQVRAAPDAGGSPGAWTAWYGASGVGSYFTDADGTLIPIALNGYQWAQYRAELAGDTVNTPSLTEVRLNYK